MVTMMTNQEFGSLFTKWQGWLKNELLSQMQKMVIDRRIFRAFQRSMVPFAGQEEGAEIAEWIARNYVANICTAIRRFGDKDKGSISLWNLLNGLLTHAKFLTPDNLKAFTGVEHDAGFGISEIKNIVRKDIDDIELYSDIIKKFVDKTIAHTDKKIDDLKLPNFADIENSFKHFHFIYRRYACWLIGTSLQSDDPNPDDLTPPDDVNYESLFARMWRD
jgi:hypothetical protein